VALMALRLRFVSFERVEFVLVDEHDVELRPVVVRVVSATDWRQAVMFPSTDTAGSNSTGDPGLDQTIRERAVEELVRLDAAMRAMQARDGWSVT
jgi:hypothetical protein